MAGWTVVDFIDFGEKETQSDQNIEEKTDATDLMSESEDTPKVSMAPIGLDVGNMAPDFKLKTLDGETVRLSDFRGERVMVNFWATWCPPCRAEMPDLEKFHQNTDIVILGVNLYDTENSIEKVEQFAEEYGLSFPILLDGQSDVANLYQIQPIPTSYMVDSNGLISNMAFGALNYDLMIQEYERMD